MTMPNGNQGRTLRIIEATETITVAHPIFLLFGQPGVGKSSLGFSVENGIFVNCDSESALSRTVNRGRAINVLTTDALCEFEEGTDLIAPFSTITIDPVGAYVDLMAADIIGRNPKYGREGSLTLQGFGVLKSRFKTWLTRARAMQKSMLLIAHHKEDKNGDTVFVRPDITGSSRDEVMRLSDFVGFMYMNGKQRMLDFNPTESWFGKNPAQWPAWKVPAPEQARTFMAQLFQKGREALSKESEASAAVANQVQDFRIVFNDYTTVQEFNTAVITLVKTLPDGVKQQVGKVLLDVAEKRGLRFDRERKVFVQPDPACFAELI